MATGHDIRTGLSDFVNRFSSMNMKLMYIGEGIHKLAEAQAKIAFEQRRANMLKAWENGFGDIDNL